MYPGLELFCLVPGGMWFRRELLRRKHNAAGDSILPFMIGKKVSHVQIGQGRGTT